MRKQPIIAAGLALVALAFSAGSRKLIRTRTIPAPTATGPAAWRSDR